MLSFSSKTDYLRSLSSIYSMGILFAWGFEQGGQELKKHQAELSVLR
jgi:hypothetical protein